MEEHSSRDGDEPKNLKGIFCGKRMKEWAFWFIVAFLAGLTIKDLYNLVKEYMENPKKSDMNGEHTFLLIKWLKSFAFLSIHSSIQ
jgi:hypothetical protein